MLQVNPCNNALHQRVTDVENQDLVLEQRACAGRIAAGLEPLLDSFTFVGETIRGDPSDVQSRLFHTDPRHTASASGRLQAHNILQPKAAHSLGIGSFRCISLQYQGQR